MSKAKKKEKKSNRRSHQGREGYWYLGKYFEQLLPEEIYKKKDPTELKDFALDRPTIAIKEFYNESASFLDLIYGKMHLYSRHLNNHFCIPYMTVKEAIALSKDPEISDKAIANDYFEMCLKEYKKLAAINEERRAHLLNRLFNTSGLYDDILDYWDDSLDSESKDSTLNPLTTKETCALYCIISHFQQLPFRKRVIKEEFMEEMLKENPYDIYNIYAADLNLLSLKEFTKGIEDYGCITIPGIMLRKNTMYFLYIFIPYEEECATLITITDCIDMQEILDPNPNPVSIEPVPLISNLVSSVCSPHTDIPLIASDIITVIPNQLKLFNYIRELCEKKDIFTTDVSSATARLSSAPFQFALKYQRPMQMASPVCKLMVCSDSFTKIKKSDKEKETE